jgi:hypothetical protein
VKPARRLVWLLTCMLAGGGIGLAGMALTGSAYWYLAVPSAIALGWLFIADPTKCETPRRRDERRT